MIITPTGSGRYSLKTGMQGHDVVALQLALKNGGFHVPIDGIFGITTESAVYSYQSYKGMTKDGVAGPATQRMFVVSQSKRYGKRLPVGMLSSICQNESGYILGARSPHPSDSGYDLGAYQRSIAGVSGVAATQVNLANALSIPFMAKDTADKIKAQHDRYQARGKVSSRRCWELAVLYHNWPFAAERLASGLSIFQDPHEDVEDAAWVISASGGRLRTPAQWVSSYIQKATALVHW